MTPDLPVEGAGVLGVGTDLVDVGRVRKSLDEHGERFLEKVFTPDERSYCMGMADPAPHLAARFAAKEAVAKAFRTGIGGEFGWRDLGVKRGPAGEPLADLSEKGAALLAVTGGREILLSLSHLATMAMAVAVITK